MIPSEWKIDSSDHLHGIRIDTATQLYLFLVAKEISVLESSNLSQIELLVQKNMQVFQPVDGEWYAKWRSQIRMPR